MTRTWAVLNRNRVIGALLVFLWIGIVVVECYSIHELVQSVDSERILLHFTRCHPLNRLQQLKRRYMPLLEAVS